IAADADPDIDHLSGMASTVFFLRLPTFSLETGNIYVIISLPCNVRPPKVKLDLLLRCRPVLSVCGA
ncbi:hypothetical protein Tco_0306767, partial [Tanacetum coccineum]